MPIYPKVPLAMSPAAAVPHVVSFARQPVPTDDTQALYNRWKDLDESFSSLDAAALNQVPGGRLPQAQRTPARTSAGSVTEGIDNIAINDHKLYGGVRKSRAKRHGPLSEAARAKASLLRKIGGCDICSRRRVSCVHIDWSNFEAGRHRSSPQTQYSPALMTTSPSEQYKPRIQQDPLTGIGSSKPTLPYMHHGSELDIHDKLVAGPTVSKNTSLPNFPQYDSSMRALVLQPQLEEQHALIGRQLNIREIVWECQSGSDADLAYETTSSIEADPCCAERFETLGHLKSHYRTSHHQFRESDKPYLYKCLNCEFLNEISGTGCAMCSSPQPLELQYWGCVTRTPLALPRDSIPIPNVSPPRYSRDGAFPSPSGSSSYLFSAGNTFGTSYYTYSGNGYGQSLETNAPRAISPKKVIPQFHLPENEQSKRATNSTETGKVNAAPSDSGYHSGIGTDTASVRSLGSVGSSLGIPQDFLQDFVAFFGDGLIDKTGARVWAKYSVAKLGPDEMERRLDKVLRGYALELDRSQSGNHIAIEAARLIRRYRPKISRYFRLNALSDPSDTKSKTEQLKRITKQLSLFERVGLLDKSGLNSWSAINETDRGRESEGGHDHESEGDHDHESEEGEVVGDMRQVKDFFINGKMFGSLATATRRALYFDDTSRMVEIHRRVENGLRYLPQGQANLIDVSFDLDWKPLEFLQSQFGNHIPNVGSLVTLTGSALYAYATTCNKYMAHTWPNTGELLLSALQSVLDAEAKSFTSKNAPEYLPIELKYGHEIRFKLSSDRELLAEVRGTKETIVDVAQQLSWLSGVLSMSPLEEQKVIYCKTDIVFVWPATSFSTPRFKIRRIFEQLHPTEDPCWLQLFSNATVAYGFPIPERLEEVGLEIPVELMAAIAGVRHAVEYDGGVVMKGFSSMLIPTKRNRGSDTVQWHLVFSHDYETRLSYQDGISRCCDRALLDELNLQSLQTTRAIVGWHGSVETVLGREDVNYGNLDYSGAGEAAQPLKIQGASLGFQQFALGQMDFTFGPKDGRCHFQRRGPYTRIVSSAEKTPVVLFDTGEHRAWLVPASGILLHVAQHRSWLDPCIVGGKKVCFKRGDSFREQLLLNATTSLSDDEQYSFKDMITSVWSILEFLLDQKVSAERSPGVDLKSTLQDILKGYEFKAIVEERSPLRLKQCSIKKTSGGWPLLIKDIDAIVLFASGFEDVIKPIRDSSGLCHRWKTVPKDNDYLATTVKMINDLYDVAGCRLDKRYLTSSRLRWHRGDSILFEACQDPVAFKCGCNRLQQVVSAAAIGNIVTPGLLESEGGIIFGFGESGTLFKRFRLHNALKAAKPTSLYRLANTTFDNGEDGSDNKEESVSLSSSNSTQTPRDLALSDVSMQSSATLYGLANTAFNNGGDGSDNEESTSSFYLNCTQIPRNSALSDVSMESSATSLSCHEQIEDQVEDIKSQTDTAPAKRKRSRFQKFNQVSCFSRQVGPSDQNKRLRRVKGTLDGCDDIMAKLCNSEEICTGQIEAEKPPRHKSAAYSRKGGD